MVKKINLLLRWFNPKNGNWLNTLAALFIVYACMPNRVFAHVRYALDVSWVYAINTAVHQKLVFGEEFIFNYGPLGYLATALPLHLADHGFTIVLYKLIIWGVLSVLGLYAWTKAGTIWQKAAILLIYALAGRLYYYESSVYFMILFAGAVLWHWRSGRVSLLWAITLFACINLFIKFNTGFVLLGIWALYLMILLIKRKIGIWSFLSQSLLGILAIWLLAVFTGTSLLAYVRNGMEIIRYYPPAQTMHVSVYSFGFLCAFLVLIGFLMLLFSPVWREPDRFSHWLLAGLSGICIFIAFKQGFVRGSDNHQVSFFAAMLILLLVLFASNSSLFAEIPLQWFALFVLFGSTIAILNIGVYSIRFWPLKDLYNKGAEQPLLIPGRITARVGKGSIDLFPFQALHLYYNHLNYIPRPIPQGYQAYSQNLDSINASYFTGARAPHWVLMANGTIDNRAPFWDEVQTKLAIRSNYTIVDTTRLPDNPGAVPIKYWLMRRNAATIRPAYKAAATSWIQSITDTIRCDAFAPVDLLRIQLELNGWGKTCSFFFQPALLQCLIQYSNGETKQYDAIGPILAAGIPVGEKLENDTDIERFLRQQPPDSASRIRAIWFEGPLGHYKKEVSLQLVRQVGE